VSRGCQKRSGIRSRGGFTLIELLIVVAIIGIIAAIAIPNLMSALDKTKQRSTMADMRQIANAVEQYGIEVNYYPEESGEIADGLDQYVEPIYIKRCPDNDGWGHPFQYSSDGRIYTIISLGKDGASQPLANGGAGGPTNSFDSDIVLVNNSFVQYPEGQQN